MKKYTHIFEPIKHTKKLPLKELAYANKIEILNSVDDFLLLLKNKLKDGACIDGGHYPLGFKEGAIYHKPTALTLLVFEIAVKLYKIAQECFLNPSLTFLVNDMGLDVSARKTVKEELILHPAYIQILEQHNLEIGSFSYVFSESNLRNRAGSLLLKKGVENGQIKSLENVLFIPSISDSNKEASLSNYIGLKKNEIEKGLRFVPFCRGIIAQKFLDSEKNACKQIISLITEHEFKCIGEFAKVYHVFGGKCPVINILFSPFELAKSEAQTYNKGLHKRTTDAYYINNSLSSFVQIQDYKLI